MWWVLNLGNHCYTDIKLQIDNIARLSLKLWSKISIQFRAILVWLNISKPLKMIADTARQRFKLCVVICHVWFEQNQWLNP